jgi:predicted CXXCH cytochrome family protein
MVPDSPPDFRTSARGVRSVVATSVPWGTFRFGAQVRRWLLGILLLMAGNRALPQALSPTPPAATPAKAASRTNRPPLSLPAFLARASLPYPAAPAAPAPSGYAGSTVCRECHRDEHASWHRSYHRTMSQPMTPETVLGKFDGSRIDSGGHVYRVFQQDGGYFAEGPDPDLMMYWVQGKKQAPPANLPRARLPVVMATGSHHYQTYWLPSPRHPGVLQTLPLVYLRETAQWVPREAAFVHGPEDQERFITQWNHHCILCHSTGGNPGLDESSGALHTQVVELGISCESCHGPAAAHVALRQKLAPGAKPDHDPIVNPAKLDAKRSSEVCGQCHGVFLHKDDFGMEFAKQGNLFRPGEALERTRHYPRHPRPGSPPEEWAEFRRNPAFFRERWWPDGQMLAGGREYSAQRDSACYEKGNLSCLSCHSMHSSDPDDQLRRDKPGATACLECHQEAKFRDDVTQHTHHAAGSVGSDCLNCHMPHTSYALLKAIRNHRIASPRAAPLSAAGPPNACNLCHLDRPVAWVQDRLVAWYGQKPVELPEADQTTAAGVRWLLEGHAGQRLITAWHLAWEPARRTGGGAWTAPLLAATLADDYGPVRLVAARSLRTQAGFETFAFDFLTPAAERHRIATDALIRALYRPPVLDPRPERLERPDGGFDQARMQQLIQKQDRRSVTIKE